MLFSSLRTPKKEKKTPKKINTSFLFFFGGGYMGKVAVLGFELRVSHLLGRHSHS
jgi:hypothetical protein